MFDIITYQRNANNNHNEEEERSSTDNWRGPVHLRQAVLGYWRWPREAEETGTIKS